MITKERLEELIKHNQTIYTTYGGYVSAIKIDNTTDYVEYDWFYEANIVANDTSFIKYTFNILFETKEEAEWHKEFGCIERTERLELPTWEEFKNDGEFSFLDKQGFEWDLYSPDDETRISLVCGYDHYEFEYTQENYTLACRKAKELFLGERK